MNKCKMCGKEDCPNIRPSGKVGLGTTTPCCKLKIINGGNIGVGTIAPTSPIQINANSLWDAWKKILLLTIKYPSLK